MVTNFPTHGIEFSIPMLPPSVNALYKVGRGGHFYKEKKASDDFLLLAKANIHNKAKLTGHVVLHVSFIFKDKGLFNRSDVDNKLKELCDTLVKCGCIANDNAIVEIHVQKLLGRENKTSGILDHGTRYFKDF